MPSLSGPARIGTHGGKSDGIGEGLVGEGSVIYNGALIGRHTEPGASGGLEPWSDASAPLQFVGMATR